MFSLCYDLSLTVLTILFLPKLLWQWFALGKYRHSLSARLGITLPLFSPKEGQKVIWIHAVSMGETRAVIPLFQMIKKIYPEAAIVISSTTETGHEEAKRSMESADVHFFLPFDFSWAIERIINRIRPSTLILSESDFWYHLLKIAKQRGVEVALVNGKVSERSSKRYQKISFFTDRLFSLFDILCVQSQPYLKRFISMGIPPEKLFVTGNLKFDIPLQKMGNVEKTVFLETLNIKDTDPVVVIGSTHAPEEEWLISALEPLWKEIPNLKVLLVPRHPERFNEVAKLLNEKKLPFSRYSEKQCTEALILIDAMGLLNSCYQIATVAIVAGSFTSHIGGHNIFEPVMYQVPVLFGPHMHSQPDLKEQVLSAKAGLQVTVEELPQVLLQILQTPSLHAQYAKACEGLSQSVQGATLRTFEKIFRTD